MTEKKTEGTFENAFLQEAMENGDKVRLIHTTGYQQNVTILDFNRDALLVQRESGSKAIVYRYGLSTILKSNEV